MTLVADFNTAISVPFSRMRQLLFEQGVQEGVVGANDLKVVQRGAGANQTVDVGAGAAWVQLDTGTRNGLGHAYNDATANVAVTAANATNPRIDQIVLRWNESSIPTGSGNIPTLAVVTGTATAGATLDNRTGAAALPSDCLRLADILVPATSTTVTTANIRDRRSWARGFYNRIVDTAGNIIVTNAAFTALSTTRLRVRVECTGNIIRVWSRVRHTVQATAGAEVAFAPLVDGALPTELGSLGTEAAFMNPAAVAVDEGPQYVWDLLPSAGSHLIDLAAKNVASTTFHFGTDIPGMFVVEEIVRQQANNGTA